MCFNCTCHGFSENIVFQPQYYYYYTIITIINASQSVRRHSFTSRTKVNTLILSKFLIGYRDENIESRNTLIDTRINI